MEDAAGTLGGGVDPEEVKIRTFLTASMLVLVAVVVAAILALKLIRSLRRRRAPVLLV